MGLCSSCGQSKDRFRDKSSRICGQIHSAVTPLHISLESTSTTTTTTSTGSSGCLLNGHLIAAITTTEKAEVGAHDLRSNGQLDKLNGHLVRSSQQRKSYTNANMAASFPNMNLTNSIKGLVSKRRNRYKQDGFNLDLTYITSKIIAMGYPASNIEGVYRNHIDDVVKLLDSKHPDHYFIYNLCSERCYDKSKFHNRVQSFPFDDHNPPKIELIQPFCRDVHEWLSRDVDNVAAVHCKAGKGRTGTMICCYLLHSGMFATADEALNHYGQKRAQDKKGVTIPSQVRYVKYYERLLREDLVYLPVPMYIREIILQPVPNFVGGQGSVCFSISQQTLTMTSGSDPSEDGSLGEPSQPVQKCIKLYKSGCYEVRKGAPNLVIKLDFCLVLNGDIKMEFYNKSKLGRKERVFQFWFNTFFVMDQQHPQHKQTETELLEKSNNGFIVEQNGGGNGGGGGVVSSAHQQTQNETMTTTTTTMGANYCDQTYVLNLKKEELDIVSKKDKQNKVFSADFQMSLLLQKIPKNGNDDGSGHHHWPSYARCEIPRLPQDTPSESSEAESSEGDSTEEGWESVLDDDQQHSHHHHHHERILMDPRGVGYRILSECEIASQLTSSSASGGGDDDTNISSGGGGSDQTQQPELLTV